MRIIIKSIVFAIIWGIIILCTTFSQLITKNGFRDFIYSEFDFASIGVSMIFMSIVFLADYIITDAFSSIKKQEKVLFKIITISKMVVLLMITIGYLNGLLNLYTILISTICFITAKTAILWHYAEDKAIKETNVEVKKIGKE